MLRKKVKLYAFRKDTLTEKRLIEQNVNNVCYLLEMSNEQIIDSKFTVTKGQMKWQCLCMDC